MRPPSRHEKARPLRGYADPYNDPEFAPIVQAVARRIDSNRPTGPWDALLGFGAIAATSGAAATLGLMWGLTVAVWSLAVVLTVKI
jgi:hypothetical protein